MTSKPLVFFRVEGGPKVGLGHVMRCLALADSFNNRKVDVLFLARDVNPTLSGPLSVRGILVLPIPSDVPVQDEGKWIGKRMEGRSVLGGVVDTYGLPDDYFLQIKKSHPSWVLLEVDDWGTCRAGIDAVLNQNIFATPDLFKGRGLSEDRIFAGVGYALIRPEFRRYAPAGKSREDADTILLTLGGGDQTVHLLNCLEAMDGLPGDPEINIILPAAGKKRSAVMEWTETRRARIWTQPKDMGLLLSKATVAVTGAGSTLWELYYLGVPHLAFIMADNQERIGKAAGEKGASIVLGDIGGFNPKQFREQLEKLLSSPEKRKALSEKGRSLVDGKGGDRVVEKFISLAPKENKI